MRVSEATTRVVDEIPSKKFSCEELIREQNILRCTHRTFSVGWKAAIKPLSHQQPQDGISQELQTLVRLRQARESLVYRHTGDGREEGV